MGNYIVDFYCKPLKLVIEVDGGYLFEDEQKIREQERQQVLESMELNFFRFHDEDVKNDIDVVMKPIENDILLFNERRKGRKQ
jgi:very-short-patch-repair endonuclease